MLTFLDTEEPWEKPLDAPPDAELQQETSTAQGAVE